MDVVKLNSKHIMFLIVGVATISLKTYPTVFTKLGGRDTWIAVCIASVLILAFLIFALFTGKKTGFYGFNEIYNYAFGKIGGLFTFLYLMTILMTMFESASVEANVVHTSFLLRTQTWVFLVVSVIASIIVVRKGGAAVVTTSIIALVMISLSGMLLSILTQKYKEFKYLFPILADGITSDFMLTILKILEHCVSLS
ncbi:MAG: hypothetical protein K0R90_1078 [Oscillospiraceae bacterium]|nr:hypothetical protein [Oscillospiraceae bacterium]